MATVINNVSVAAAPRGDRSAGVTAPKRDQLVPCQPSIEGLGGTVWRSQAVGSCSDHGLSTSSLDRATHQNRFDRALERYQLSCCGSDEPLDVRILPEPRASACAVHWSPTHTRNVCGRPAPLQARPGGSRLNPRSAGAGRIVADTPPGLIRPVQFAGIRIFGTLREQFGDTRPSTGCADVVRPG